MDAQSNASEAALDQARRKRSRLVQTIDPAFPGVRGLRDLWQGWRDYRELWFTVGLFDIRKRYRRSVLGPFWITISLGAFILGLGFIYSPLVGGGTASFLPFVAFGFIAWQFISQLVLDGCNVFIANGPIIQQLQAPLSIYIYQTIWRHLIILAHNLLIYVMIALLYGLWPSSQTLLVVPGIILVSINGVSIGMLLGTLCARFRDIPPIVQTITQMMFLLTPILWRPNQIPGRELFYLLNPFYYLVEIIRAPLEGRAPSLFVWTVVLAITAAGFVVSLLFFSRFRNRIVYLAMRAPMVSVHLRSVTVSFPIYDTRSRSLKRRAMSVVTGGRVRSDPTGRISTDASHRVSIRALDRIDLAIEHGTRIGLVGRNGAGKSTLLRVLAGIYVPESGRVEVVGKSASLFGGSLGIDPELSGRENIELRGLYLGLSKEEIAKRMDDVIAFTELGPFIEMPFRAYSAGMRARLDFAISTAIQAEILLLDEGLGAGDASFIEKANERLSKLAEAAGIVVVATHSEELLRKTCTTAALMEAGHILATGSVEEVLERYHTSLAA